MIRLLPLLLLLASCSASHKIKTSEKKTLDSTSTITLDTTRVTHEETSSSNLQAQDVHIRIDYRPISGEDSIYNYGRSRSYTVDTAPIPNPYYKPPTKKTGNKFVDAIQDAVAAAGNTGNLSSIRIDIGRISDSSTTSSKKDSGTGKTVSTTAVHKEEQSKSKEVWRPYFGPLIWTLVFLVLGIIIYRYRGKIKTFFITLLKL